jgi:MFS family permease
VPLRALSERRLLFLVGAVQFVNVLDFMMVMPLGPDFAASLGIPVARLGIVGGSYTVAAAAAGLAGAFFLDRFDRRKALGLALFRFSAETCPQQGHVRLVLRGSMATTIPPRQLCLYSSWRRNSPQP